MIATNNDLEALIRLKQLFAKSGTPIPQFLHWVADRLTLQHGDLEGNDFIQKLRRVAHEMYELSELVEERRGVEHVP